MPSTDWKEQISPGEAARFEAHAAFLATLQQKHARGSSKARALHAKGTGGLEAQLTVLGDLPEHARVGLFAAPKTYRTYVRFSNGDPAVRRDRTADVRGLAIKVVGVGGKKLIPGLEDAPTQDFLLIQSAATPFKDTDEFIGFVRAMQVPALALPRIVALLGFSRTLKLLKGLKTGTGAPVPSLATLRYHTALPLRFGACAVKLDALPKTPFVAGPTPESLGAELSARLERGPVEFDLRAQFFVDERRTPIEDASVAWPEDLAPFTTLARLTIPQQKADSERGRKLADFVERLSFDPWHAQEELRPLGNMMRGRNVAYRVSTQARGVAKEPDGSETF